MDMQYSTGPVHLLRNVGFFGFIVFFWQINFREIRNPVPNQMASDACGILRFNQIKSIDVLLWYFKEIINIYENHTILMDINRMKSNRNALECKYNSIRILIEMHENQ